MYRKRRAKHKGGKHFGDFIGAASPCVPTHYLPRTAAKIQVLCERAAAGQELFHPEDAVLPDRLGLVAHPEKNRLNQNLGAILGVTDITHYPETE